MNDLRKFEDEHTTLYPDIVRICDLKFDGRKRFKLIFINNPRIILDVSGAELKKDFSSLHPIKKIEFPMVTTIYF